MEVSKKILAYLSMYGKENKYRLASTLKIDAGEITKALSDLEKKGKIEMKGGRAVLVKGKKPITPKAEKQKKQPTIEVEKEQQQTEVSGETTEEGIEEEKPLEEEKVEEEETQSEEAVPEKEELETEEEEERLEGTVKFFNPNKGFGFIIGDNGKEYYVHKSALKEGVTIEADDRVSFKAVQGDKGPKAEEVEWISQA